MWWEGKHFLLFPCPVRHCSNRNCWLKGKKYQNLLEFILGYYNQRKWSWGESSEKKRKRERETLRICFNTCCGEENSRETTATNNICINNSDSVTEQHAAFDSVQGPWNLNRRWQQRRVEMYGEGGVERRKATSIYRQLWQGDSPVGRVWRWFCGRK